MAFPLGFKAGGSHTWHRHTIYMNSLNFTSGATPVDLNDPHIHIRYTPAPIEIV